MFPHLRITFHLNACLGELLIFKRVDHAHPHLDDSLDDVVLVHEEHVAESSFTSPPQACDVLFLDDLAAADLREQWVQVRVSQALLRSFTEVLV